VLGSSAEGVSLLLAGASAEELESAGGLAGVSAVVSAAGVPAAGAAGVSTLSVDGESSA
jgi:hypothetical protein